MNKLSQNMGKICAFLEEVRGWKRLGVAFACGLLDFLAFPPFSVFPVLMLSFPAFVCLLRGTDKPRQAAAVGWFFALGHLVPNLYWIAGALFVDIGSFWWALPGAVLGLPAFFALYNAIACGIVRRWVDLRSARGVLLLAVAWFVADEGRAHLFTGFPWNILGYAWGDYLPVMQVVSVIGIEGLSLLTALLVFWPAACVTREGFAKRAGVRIGVPLLLLGLLAVGGEARLLTTTIAPVEGQRVRLVQTDIAQAMKWKADQSEENFDKIISATFAPADKPFTLIVWPETATAFYLGEDIDHRLFIASKLPVGARLFTGTVQRALNDKGSFDYFNSIIVLNASGYIIGGYDKAHLVPFGEYIPYRDYIHLRALTALGMNFSAGKGVQTLRLPDFPSFSPLVCYEAIFSGEVALGTDRPHVLINATNDAWYDGTIGPAQHFAIVRARAIEEGVPLLRASNQGVTAAVDPLGRVWAERGAHDAGFVDSDLPQRLEEAPLFARFGNGTGGLLTVFTLLILIFPSFVLWIKKDSVRP